MKQIIETIMRYSGRPQLFEKGTSNFWDDPHISNHMLESHLNPDWDAATRTHEFIDRSVSWISKIVPSSQYELLLDLGCGPGLYAERFKGAGYSVTGVDFSKRSIEYAKKQTLSWG
jgi:2-polyprenyl-3-methyl-5-hydroxy-6-metoxy-1,4-benzoquinol methylase